MIEPHYCCETMLYDVNLIHISTVNRNSCTMHCYSCAIQPVLCYCIYSNLYCCVTSCCAKKNYVRTRSNVKETFFMRFDQLCGYDRLRNAETDAS